LVVRVRTAALRVGRHAVAGGAGDAAGARAAALERLRLLALLERDALRAVDELLLGGLVRVEVGVDLHLRLVGPERAGEHRREALGERLVVARLGGLLREQPAAAA